MNERTCGKCGANSAAGAHYCWQCYTRFGAPADAVQDRPAAYAGPLAAAIGRGPGAGTASAVVTEPATMTRWQPVHETGGDRAAGWVIKGLVAVLGALVGYFGYQWLTRGFELPEEIAGQPRMEGDFVEEFEDLLDSFGGSLDVELEMAIYGRGIPVYFMAAAEIPDGQDVGQFYQGFVAGSGTSTDFGNADPNDVTCAAFPGGVGAQCSWVQDEVVLLLQGFAATEVDLQSVADGVHSDLD